VNTATLQADFYDALEPMYGPEVASFIAAPLVDIVLAWMQTAHFARRARR